MSTALPSTVVSGPKESKLLNRIQNIMNNLPDSVPIASSQDRLVVFHHDPHLLVGTTKNGDDLWEDTLNSFLKDALGWGLNKYCKIGFVMLVSPRRKESTCAIDQMML